MPAYLPGLVTIISLPTSQNDFHISFSVRTTVGTSNGEGEAVDGPGGNTVGDVVAERLSAPTREE